MAIFNQYKDTLDDLTHSSDPRSLNQVELIDNRSHNTPISENSLTDLSEEDSLNENL